MKIKKLVYISILCCVSCTSVKYNQTEFRGVWVATVVNIDWPKSSEDSVQKQKEDFIALLDFYEQLHFNSVIVQIRTAGDAFYDSEVAPWSRFLTGKEGNPKQGFEAPLEWMINETHRRGMEFHAWLNPYRATFDLDTTLLADNHDFHEHRDWMVKYGKKYYYNPGIPKVWQHLTQVVEEVVVKYDVDGIHFDDYFYPYKIAGESFNDTLTFQDNHLHNQKLEDWRRSNIDSLVKNVHAAIAQKKPWVQFGISPFGVWKNKDTDPKGSDTKAGQTTYEDLYADPLLWMEKEWLDYIAPQAYWSMDYPAASHKIITEWWAGQNTTTQIYMGNGAYKIQNNPDQAWDKRNELPKQLDFSRSTPRVNGNIFFSAKSLPEHPVVANSIRRKVYRKLAQVPPSANKPDRNLEKPAIISTNATKGFVEICLSHYDSVPRYLSVYQLKRKTRSPKELLKKVYLPSGESKSCFTIKGKAKKLGMSVRDAYGNESPLKTISN